MNRLDYFKELVIPEFFGVEEDCSYERCEGDKVLDLAIAADKLVECDYAVGASKMCLIPEGDYVVKIPFNCTIIPIPNFDDDDENNEIDYNYERFESAGNSENSWDYCLTELEIYNKIKEAGFECFVAKTEKLGETAAGYPLYIQEKVLVYNDITDEYKFSASQGSKEKSKKAIDEYWNHCHSSYDSMSDDAAIGYVFSGPGSIFLSEVIEAYGYDLVAKFSQWVVKHEDIRSQITSDLHWGNIGFKKSNEKPCLLDFSGFYE